MHCDARVQSVRVVERTAERDDETTTGERIVLVAVRACLSATTSPVLSEQTNERGCRQ